MGKRKVAVVVEDRDALVDRIVNDAREQVAALLELTRQLTDEVEQDGE